MRDKQPLVPFERYGFTAEDYRAHRAWVLSGGPEPDSETTERVRKWSADTYEMRQARAAAKKERHRRFWRGFWSLTGIAAIVLLTISVTLTVHVHLSEHAQATMGLAAILIGVAAFVGRDNNRKDDR